MKKKNNKEFKYDEIRREVISALCIVLDFVTKVRFELNKNVLEDYKKNIKI